MVIKVPLPELTDYDIPVVAYLSPPIGDNGFKGSNKASHRHTRLINYQNHMNVIGHDRTRLDPDAVLRGQFLQSRLNHTSQLRQFYARSHLLISVMYAGECARPVVRTNRYEISALFGIVVSRQAHVLSFWQLHIGNLSVDRKGRPYAQFL